MTGPAMILGIPRRAPASAPISFGKGQYVTFNEEEIQSMAQQANKLVEIMELVPAASARNGTRKRA
jgi:hypothetical protein